MQNAECRNAEFRMQNCRIAELQSLGVEMGRPLNALRVLGFSAEGIKALRLTAGGSKKRKCWGRRGFGFPADARQSPMRGVKSERVAKHLAG